MKINVVILAGGSGTRLWPLSRSMRPKQFLNIYDDNSMLQNTIKRLDDIDIESSVIICNEEHRFFVAEQVRSLNYKTEILLEPEAKNTAPAICLAAMMFKPDDLVLVLSADHFIDNTKAFKDSIQKAKSLASHGTLVTFGVKPTRPDTNYGYIKTGKKIDHGFHVEQFKEKPSIVDSELYAKSKDFLWNCGIFLFKSGSYISELQKYRPDIKNVCQEAINDIRKDIDFIRINEVAFKECPAESIDYAVMEKTKKATVIQMNSLWSDLGSYDSLWEIQKKDNDNNYISGDVLSLDTKNSFIVSEDSLLVTVGVDDLIIVQTNDATLIAKKNEVQKVKQILTKMKKQGRDEINLSKKVYRPWGSYGSLGNGSNYQVKSLQVNPGAKLSLQSHSQRSEYWVVVKGIATVKKDNKEYELNENESTFIAAKTIHSLENKTSEKLELIEVQYGEYLGEDDIIRYEDLYNRSN